MSTAELTELITPMHGWCTPEKAAIIYDLVISTNSQLTVELGVFGGRSFIPLSLAHKEKKTGFCIGIDSWKKDTSLHGTNDRANNDWWEQIDFYSIYTEVQRLIYANELEDYCDTLRMRSQQAALIFGDNTIDILHQDTAHNEETITEELELWTPKLKIGGYWIADDTAWKEAKSGYAKLPDHGLELIADFNEWQIWRKVR